jgi:hypothetical protein
MVLQIGGYAIIIEQRVVDIKKKNSAACRHIGPVPPIVPC